ncbi:MAG: ABC transporter permease [Bacteroidales bacterium]|nr:ABC transporter permease [Bacteroidales bacterium]
MHTKKLHIEITPKKDLFDINIKEIFRYKDLLFLFVRRDFVATYKQTILGPIWFLIQPILSSLVFYIVFNKFGKISTNGIPPFLFYMAGLTGWNYFSSCLTATSNVFVGNAGIFGKVYFPRLITPLSIVISNLIKFGIQLFLFLVFYSIYWAKGYDLNMSIYILFLPFLIFLMAGLGLGFGLTISALTTKYRDLTFLLAFSIQLLMYATPVIYPLSDIPEKYRFYIMLNPMSSVIETFKTIFFNNALINWYSLFYSLVFMVIMLFIGVVIFNKTERNFMDTV